MATFDVVSKINSAEVDNAVLQSQKELGTRYDFRDTGTSLERTADGLVLVSNSEGRLEAALEVLQGKLLKRGISLKCVDPQKPQPAARGTFRQLVKLKEGIDRDNARKVLELVKGSKLKVQASIHEDTVRVTGKNKDDLQAVMKLLRGEDFPIELQFTNFRD
ncbi:MAG: YajQ family cyclic di-GMP-binding protein [Deltaproteobacteria bacterium]|nr:YajQ family cyclic di-GMP-binding protein [Deltaproteobacteria bacterium]